MGCCKSRLPTPPPRTKARPRTPTPPLSSNQWVLDSGATSHIVNDRSLLHDYTDATIVVHTSEKGRTTKAGGRGSLMLRVTDDTGAYELVLPNVIYDPTAFPNLVSVGELESKGAAILFQDGKAVLTFNGLSVALATRRGRLYFLEKVACVKQS